MLFKNPARVHGFDLSFGKATVFYPEATAERCTVCLLLEADPIGMVRRKSGAAGDGGIFGQYVNDRPYVASSFLAVAISEVRATVRQVIGSGQRTVPPLLRAERCEPWRGQILELHAQYQGHLGRVYEELLKGGATLSYPALTAFCRRHRIGSAPLPPAGRYEFPAGREMQHDTSPHTAEIGGVRTRVQTASVVLCYSRTIFFQMYPRFTRFECKAFLTKALTYFNGAAATCMIDNSHVIVAAGSGATMIPAPEMAAFAERFGFTFIATRRAMRIARRGSRHRSTASNGQT